MVMCFVSDCYHYSEKKTCSWFRFPKDPLLKKKWIRNIRRQDRDPTIHSMICSCHFKDGDRKNMPTFFERNKDSMFTYTSPERKKRRLKKRTKVDALKGVSAANSGHVSRVESVQFEPRRTLVVIGNQCVSNRILQRSRRNTIKKEKLQPALVATTALDKQRVLRATTALEKQEVVKGCDFINNPVTNVAEKKLLKAKEKLRSAPKADLNSDDFDPLDLNNLLLSTSSVFQGMCKELELSTIMNKHVDYLNLDKERITLKTSAGDSEKSLQIVIVNKKSEDSTPTFSESTGDIERMLADVEKTVMAAEKDLQDTVETRTISTQTFNRTLEVENKNLKLEIEALKNRIYSLQNRKQHEDVPKLLVVCNDE